MSQTAKPATEAASRKASANPAIQRKSFGLRDQISGALKGDYHSGLVEAIRESGGVLEAGATRIVLAKEFGFCYGVDRAVQLAYETVERFPDKRVFITHEIIHNPNVNRRLLEMGVRFLATDDNVQGDASYDDIGPDDVVIWPAFGVSAELQKRLEGKGCLNVDATCGSVMHVWKRVEKYARDGLTSIIHGKYRHEETVATASRAASEGGKYIVVRDEPQALALCEMIEGVRPATQEAFGELFGPAAPAEFDPANDLLHIGFANQTTMLASESLHLAKLFRESLARRFGPAYVEDQANFRSFDTICSATQDRQDAIVALRAAKPDVTIVVGGFNSSNTEHLAEMAAQFSAAYHIDEAHCLISAQEIRHRPPHRVEGPILTSDWLPSGPLTIGVTAGASTPNRMTGEAIERILELRGEKL